MAETVVSINAEPFEARIIVEMLTTLPIKNSRKLFTILAKNEYENRESIYVLSRRLSEIVEEKKNAWKVRSEKYQDGYQFPGNFVEGGRGYKNAKSDNRKLLSEVKQAKADHDRWAKILKSWEDIKAKYDIKGEM